MLHPFAASTAKDPFGPTTRNRLAIPEHLALALSEYLPFAQEELKGIERSLGSREEKEEEKYEEDDESALFLILDLRASHWCRVTH